MRLFRHQLILAFVMTAALATSANADAIFGGPVDGGQEVPPTPSAGSGTVVATLNPAQTTLTVRIDFSGLTGATTAQHIHAAPIGAAGPVRAGLPAPVGGVINFTWAIPAAQVSELLQGLLYVNLHTAAFGGGEIRGQLDMMLQANMDGKQEVPPNASPGVGHALARWNPQAKRIIIIESNMGNLTGPVTASHIHRGAAGVSGPVAVALPLPNPTATGTWTGISTADSTALLSGGLYVNWHTAAFPGGEIRGQLQGGSAMTSVEPGLVGAATGLRSYPNPMSASSTIRFALTRDEPVSLRVVDATGRVVRELSSGMARVGENQFIWDGRDARGSRVPAGVYYYVLRTGAGQETAKTIVLR